MVFLFAINPASGGKSKDDWENAIQTHFADAAHTAELFHLDGKTDEEELTARIAQLSPDCVVAVGGDGTIKAVAEHLLNSPIRLGILPAGSANGMARELGIPPTIEESLQVLTEGHTQPIDVIDVNGELCIHLSDIGLNAQMVRYYQQNNLRGKWGYLKSALNVMRNRRMLHLTITIGAEQVHRAAFMVVLANARMYGTGAVINPDGNPSDGAFEIVILRRLNFWESLKMFWQFRPFDPKRIEVLKTTSLTIETKRKAYFQIDGEYRGRVAEISAHIRPGALQILLPKTPTAGV